MCTVPRDTLPPAPHPTTTTTRCYVQATEMMRNIPAEQLAAMSKMAGVPGMDPEALAQVQRSMASMSPDQMEAMMRMSASMGGTPGSMGQDPAVMAKVRVQPCAAVR
jgi:hypothetical protein